MGFNLIHDIEIPEFGFKRKTHRILLMYDKYNNLSLQFLCAYFPSKLGVQTKKGSWNPQCKQCNLANHTDIADNHCVPNQAYL